MKVGMIFECGPQGADVQVCMHLAKKAHAQIEIEPVTLNNKPNLIAKCGDAAATLIQSRCERVIIVWDLFPPWRQNGAKPCRKNDREEILRSLTVAGVPHAKVGLVCIEQELETWLIADERALCSFLSKPTREARIDRCRKPELKSNPKAALHKHFNDYRGNRYVDYQHALGIAKRIPDWGRLRRCSSFTRFIEKSAGIKL